MIVFKRYDIKNCLNFSFSHTISNDKGTFWQINSYHRSDHSYSHSVRHQQLFLFHAHLLSMYSCRLNLIHFSKYAHDHQYCILSN